MAFPTSLISRVRRPDGPELVCLPTERDVMLFASRLGITSYDGKQVGQHKGAVYPVRDKKGYHLAKYL
ncbi:MAG: hypothetical protein R2744_13560 [Bacteroidales bacterium]